MNKKMTALKTLLALWKIRRIERKAARLQIREEKKIQKLFKKLQADNSALVAYMIKAKIGRARRRQIAKDLIANIQKGQQHE